MTVETALYPQQLNTALPASTDFVSEGDDHLRLLKTVLKTTFPNVAGAIAATDVQLGYVAGVTSPLQTQLNAKGAVTGQAWTGAHGFGGSITVPTLAQGTNTTGAASSAFVLAEWAARLPNYTAPITASSTELNYVVGVTGGIQAQLSGKGAVAGQAWAGVQDFTGAASVLVPTKAAGDASGAAASTAFVTATAFASNLPGQAGKAGKFVTTDGTNAAWAFPRLIPQAITANTTAAPGYAYLIAASGITLTVPATFTARDAFAFSVGVGFSAQIDWTTNKLKNGTPGVMNVRSKQAANLIYVDNTYGFMEAA
ncbi:MAG: hypothetical protein KGM60_10855 [Comamonadaceae bacterium]|nr:hypothetical protein [Comamonadaceae bacterium]